MLKITRKRDTYGDFSGDDSFYNESDFNNMDINDDNVTGFGMDSMQSPMTPEQPAPAPAPATVALKIINPRGYDEAPDIVDYLMGGNTVLVNVEGLSREHAVRMLDYLSGAIKAVGGIMTKVGRTTLVIAPKNVDVSSIEAMVGGNN